MPRKSAKSTSMRKPEFKTVQVAIANLRPHPRNYKSHPDDQLDHLVTSITENGFTKNVVATIEGTILAGHGVVAAAEKMGFTHVPTNRINVDPEDPAAIKLLVSDNEIEHLGIDDDRLLTELLREIRERDGDGGTGLPGTGFDDKMLAALLMVTRDASEIAGFDEAAHWIGMPEFEEKEMPVQALVSFRTEADRTAFIKLLDVEMRGKGRIQSCWWPHKERNVVKSIRFETDA